MHATSNNRASYQSADYKWALLTLIYRRYLITWYGTETFYFNLKSIECTPEFLQGPELLQCQRHPSSIPTTQKHDRSLLNSMNSNILFYQPPDSIIGLSVSRSDPACQYRRLVSVWMNYQLLHMITMLLFCGKFSRFPAQPTRFPGTDTIFQHLPSFNEAYQLPLTGLGHLSSTNCCTAVPLTEVPKWHHLVSAISYTKYHPIFKSTWIFGPRTSIRGSILHMACRDMSFTQCSFLDISRYDAPVLRNKMQSYVILAYREDFRERCTAFTTGTCLTSFDCLEICVRIRAVFVPAFVVWSCPLKLLIVCRWYFNFLPLYV